MMQIRAFAAASLAALVFSGPVSAGEAGNILRESLYDGSLSDGLTALLPMAEAGDQEARFGVGMLTFFTGVEGLLQALYRYGLGVPDTSEFGPLLSVPIPTNPTPEPLDYETFRAVLQQLVTTLDEGRDILMEAGESGDYVVMLDPLRFRVDINGDGQSDEAESVGAVIAAATGESAALTMGTAPPVEGGKDKADKIAETKPGGATPRAEPMEPGIGFDRADAIWLAGYANVVAGQSDFLLAHDFSEFFNSVFHRFFPRAGLPMQNFSQGTGTLIMDPQSDTAIADLIAAIHTINWPVVEPDRLRGVLDRAHAVVAASRQNWTAILAETDDVAELIPSPTQTPTVQGEGGRITEDMVAAWMDTLDKVDLILDGELLIPHWRLRGGFDLKAYFETATRTDLVMLVTGYGALPYMKPGPIADAETFAAANAVFGDDLMGYAFWFN